MVTPVVLILIRVVRCRTMRLPDYKNRMNHNFHHNMDSYNTNRTGIRDRIRIRTRIRILDHNTYHQKNVDCDDKISVAYFVYILHY
jgi:hypothetical protein